jgi:hypothetical protein
VDDDTEGKPNQREMKMKANINAMVGVTFTKVDTGDSEYPRLIGSSVLAFHSTDGRIFKFFHEQDCCESVSLEEIIGDISDLIGSPILHANEESDYPEEENSSDDGESTKWTFYSFRTNKGTVTLRWVGTSNGYYSTDVDLAILDSQGKKLA